MKKVLFLILDGLGDRPVAALNNMTPLEAAESPSFDHLADLGQTGLIEPVFEGKFPTSKEGHLGLFGYAPDDREIRRGIFEALGVGMDLKPGDVALRGNFATVDENKIILDRRAGRIKHTKPLVESLNGINIDGVEVLVGAGVSHRLGVVLRGEGLSNSVSDGDKHKTGITAPEIKALEKTKEAVFTASVLNKFIKESNRILRDHPLNKERQKKGLPPANFVLLRGAGRLKSIESFEQKWGRRAACIAGGALYKGIGRALGMELLQVDGATGKADTNLEGKFKKAEEALGIYDFVYLHIKATDNFSHDGDCLGKKKFIEKIDQYFSLFPDFESGDNLIIITGDHCTSCEEKEHVPDPIPVLVFGRDKDNTNRFGERFCREGSLGKIRSTDFLKKILSLHSPTM